MTRGALHRIRGFSLLELSVIGVIALLLLAVAFSRYAGVQAQAENAARQAVLDSLHTALTLKAAEIALRQGAGHVHLLEKHNPFDLLDEKPANYGGETPLSGELVAAHWYYSSNGGEIIYTRRWTGSVFPRPESRLVEHYHTSVRFGAGGVDGVVLEPAGTTEQGQ